MSTTFRTKSGKEYDLRLDFYIARKLGQWDFSKVSDTPFSIMNPAKTAFNQLYYDMGLLGAIAFAIVWERQKLSQPEGDFSPTAQTAAELDFTRELDGETLDALQSALWESFTDFFRKQASDLKRICLAQKTAEEENAKLSIKSFCRFRKRQRFNWKQFRRNSKSLANCLANGRSTWMELERLEVHYLERAELGVGGLHRKSTGRPNVNSLRTSENFRGFCCLEWC